MAFTENELEKIILAAFPDYNSFFMGCSIRSEKNPDGTLSEVATLIFSSALQQDIENNISDFINRLGNSFDRINFLFKKKAKLTNIATQRAIKILQPVSWEDLFSYLEKKNFYIDERLIKNALDRLRREKKLVLENNRYSLSEISLIEVPHGNFHASSDIVRALEFQKKKW